MGWKALTTPAVPKLLKEVVRDANGSGNGDDSEETLRKFQNSGGDMLLFQAGVTVYGHHQPEGTSGFRAAQVRFHGWTLHLVTVYLDCNYGMQEGPNFERTQGVISLVKATRLAWVIIGDFNKTPEEVAESDWCKFLKGVILACPLLALELEMKEGGSSTSLWPIGGWRLTFRWKLFSMGLRHMFTR